MSNPRATWSTAHPSSATLSSLTLTTTRTKPAPIYNPYDKFTKPQFDAWIDDLTGTLRRALGHIDDGGREKSLVMSNESSTGHIDAEQVSKGEEVGDIEDSFAEFKARRASRKGKGRDPREGPGLFSGRGNGSYEEPIDLASDSEDEEAQVEELARIVDDTDDSSEWEEQDVHERSKQDAEDVDAEADAGVEYEGEVDYDEEAGSDLEEENEMREEDEDEEQSDMWRSDQSYSPPVQYEVLDADDADHVEKSDEPEVIELLSDEEVSMGGSSPPAQGDTEEDSDAEVDEEDQGQGAHEDAAASPEIYDIEDNDEQPLYDDTAFPPTLLDYPLTIEIVDPWVRPQLYANDLYKGGDHLPDPESHPSPHKLGDTDDASTSITPQHEMDKHTMVFEVSRDKSLEAASHPRSQSLDASYTQYDPKSVDVDSSNMKEFNNRPDEYEGEDISLDSNADVSNRRPDERHPDNTTNDDVTAPSINLEESSNDNFEDLPLFTEDMHGQADESNIRAVSPELAMTEKQRKELPTILFVNQTEEIVFDLYEDLETDGLTVEMTEQPVFCPVDHGDGANVQGSQNVPMSTEPTPREDQGSDPPHLFIEPGLVPEVLAGAELEASQHIAPDVVLAAGLTHHQPFGSKLSPTEGQSLPQHVTADVAPVAGLKEFPEDDRDAEEPAFFPTPPAEGHTSCTEDISSALCQVHSILDDTGAGDDLEPQEAKHEPSSVPEAVDHDAMDIHDENQKFISLDNPAVAPEPAVVHIEAASDIVVELNDDHGGQEVVAPAEISNQEVIAADEDNHPTVLPQKQADGISALVSDVSTVRVDDNSALELTVDTDKIPAEESPIAVMVERCAALVNDGPPDVIDNGSAALAHGSLTLPLEEGLTFELPSVVAVGDDSDIHIDNNPVVRVDDSSVPPTNESTEALVDGAAVPDEQNPSSPVDDSPSVLLDNITTSPVDALVPTDKAHTVDDDMVVEVSPQSPHGIEVVDAKTTTDTSPTIALPDIASSSPAASGSPAPADPHTPPTQTEIQTGFSPLFTPRTYIKRRPPGLMTTPPSSEGDMSDYVRSPPQHDGEESQRGPELETDPVHDSTGDQIIMDFQDALAGMKPSDSIRSVQSRRESLTRTSHVVPTIRARAMSVLQPDPYPYSLSTPGVAQYVSKSGSDEVSEDENENDLSNTSSSSNDRELGLNNQDIPDPQNMLEPSVDAHVQSEKPSISKDVQAFKDGIPPPQPIKISDNSCFTGPLSPIEDLTDIESSPKKLNGASSITPRQIPHVVIKTDIGSAKHHGRKSLNPESPTVDQNDAQGSVSTKRKRKSAGSKRLTHALSSRKKGKQKEDSNGSPAPSDATSPGGLAAKLLTYSRKSSVSRASSSTPSEASVATSQVPPTPTRPANALHHPPVHYPPALLHGHSSQPRSVRHQHHLPTAGPSRASSTSSLDRPLYYSSPVTRSNCRYRRISLPKVENGPRISFLVPGCSLGDAELMEDEEIIDHGDATTEESRRVVPDIENLDFSPYLIGVLRQLVGVDLLREQEVYYLCAVGEDPRLVQKKKADRFIVNRIGESSNSPRPLSESFHSPSSSMRPPVSAASATPSGIVVKKEDDGYESSMSLSTVESHTELLVPRPAKRQKTSVDTSPPSASTSRTKTKGPTKRSLKPIAYISAPVVPVPEEEDSDLSGSELPFDHRPKVERAKGLKRARTDVRADEEEGRRFKKLKGRLSDIH
ncbi:hypothetical protein DFS33DRAFT_1377020 [Desarmillaria ectypa]|nr:hypothetical protein DFS33DRAFT_1377020 [Desarmillaria ectypa]